MDAQVVFDIGQRGLLMLLMVFALKNDVKNLFFGG